MKLFTILVLLYFSDFYSQKTGIVSDVNPVMGYVITKGELFTEGAFLEKDLDYNIMDFFAEYYKKQNKEYSFPENFEFWSENLLYEEGYEYLKTFCTQKNIDQLLIIFTNKNYMANDPMLMYRSLEHQLGIEAYKKTPTRAVLYGNFRIYLFDAASDRLKTVANTIYFPHRFKARIFDKENYDFTNSEAKEIFVNDLETFLTKKLDKHYSK